MNELTSFQIRWILAFFVVLSGAGSRRSPFESFHSTGLRPLPGPLANEGNSIRYLARCLMFELIIFAEEVFTETALESSSAEIPDSALAFGANYVRQHTSAGVSLEALPSVTNERLAEVTNGAHHA